MITYHLRTPFTLVRRAVRLSHHATPRHGTARHAMPGRAEPSRFEPRRATPRCVASRHTPRRLAASHDIRPRRCHPILRILPRHAIALTVQCHYHRASVALGCYAIDPTLRPTNSSPSSSVSLRLFRILFFSAKSVVHRSRPRAPLSYVLIATAAFPCRGKLN